MHTEWRCTTYDALNSHAYQSQLKARANSRADDYGDVLTTEGAIIWNANMRLPTFLFLSLQLAVVVRSFGTSSRSIVRNSVLLTPRRQIRSTTPTMVVYWSIKSAYDLGKYALGNSNKFVGTGVWSFIKFSKETDKDEVPGESAESKTKSSKSKQRDDAESK